MKVDTERATDATFDTLLVGSAPDVRPSPPELISFLRGVLPKTRRIASICIVAFILGEAGFIRGHPPATTQRCTTESHNRVPHGSVDTDHRSSCDCHMTT